MPSGPSSGNSSMLLDAIATTSRPLASYSFANRANSERMCFTNGQCLQMKATSSALLPLMSASVTVFPLKSGSENRGSGVPRSSMVDGVSGIETPRERQLLIIDRLLSLASLLLGERRLEHRFLDIRLQVAVRLVDERVRPARLQLRVLLLHAVLRAVVAERHVARQRARDLERALELARDLGRDRRPGAIAAVEHDVVVLPAVSHDRGPRRAPWRVARGQVRHQLRAAERHGIAVVHDAVDRMVLSARLDRLQRVHVLGHRDDLPTGELLHLRVTFLVVAVCMVAEQDLDVGELEPEVGDRLLDDGHVPLVRAVDQDVPLRRDDQERAERLRPDVVDVADDLVRRKLRLLIRGGAHVAREDRPRRVDLAVDGDGRVIGSAGLGEDGYGTHRGNEREADRSHRFSAGSAGAWLRSARGTRPTGD